MAVHRLSVEDQIRGLKKGIRKLRRTRRGPVWLIPSMQKRLKALEAEVSETKRNSAKRRKTKKPAAA